jgi:hypothetical protein
LFGSGKTIEDIANLEDVFIFFIYFTFTLNIPVM